MNLFRIMPRAQRDLLGIEEWIRQDNPSRAVSFVADLIERFQRLAERPMIGRARPEMGQDFRSIPHGKFLIFYRPSARGIGVLRVIHGSRDLRRGLRSTPGAHDTSVGRQHVAFFVGSPHQGAKRRGRNLRQLHHDDSGRRLAPDPRMRA